MHYHWVAMKTKNFRIICPARCTGVLDFYVEVEVGLQVLIIIAFYRLIVLCMVIISEISYALAFTKTCNVYDSFFSGLVSQELRSVADVFLPPGYFVVTGWLWSTTSRNVVVYWPYIVYVLIALEGESLLCCVLVLSNF